jgi:hypothetical protein
MEVQLQLPSAVEADWLLVDDNGKEIATSKDHPGATLLIEPYFYRGAYSQILARTVTRGKKGKETKNTLRVAAQTGKITSELSATSQSKIVPKFDTQAKS